MVSAGQTVTIQDTDEKPAPHVTARIAQSFLFNVLSPWHSQEGERTLCNHLGDAPHVVYRGTYSPPSVLDSLSCARRAEGSAVRCQRFRCRHQSSGGQTDASGGVCPLLTGSCGLSRTASGLKVMVTQRGRFKVMAPGPKAKGAWRHT